MEPITMFMCAYAILKGIEKALEDKKQRNRKERLGHGDDVYLHSVTLCVTEERVEYLERTGVLPLLEQMAEEGKFIEQGTR